MVKWTILILAVTTIALQGAEEPAASNTDNQPQIILLEGKLTKIRFEPSRVKFFSSAGEISLSYDYIAKIIKKKSEAGAKTNAEKADNQDEKVQTVKLKDAITQAQIGQDAVNFISPDGSIKISFAFLLKSITKKAISPGNLARMFSRSEELYCFRKLSNGNRLKAWKKNYFKSPHPGDIYKKLVVTSQYVFVQDEKKTIFKITRGCQINHETQYPPIAAFIKNQETVLILKNKQKKQYEAENKSSQKTLEDYQDKSYLWRKRLRDRMKYDKTFNRKSYSKSENPYSSDIRKLKKKIRSTEHRIEELDEQISIINTLLAKLKSAKPW